MAIKRRGPKSAKDRGRKLTGKVAKKQTAKPAKKKPAGGVKDRQIEPAVEREAFSAAEGALFFGRVPQAPAALDLLRDRDGWLNPDRLPKLSQHLTPDRLALCAFLLAQGASPRALAAMTGVAREVWTEAREEVVHMREVAALVLTGTLKTRLWVRGVMGSDMAAKLWLETQQTRPGPGGKPPGALPAAGAPAMGAPGAVPALPNPEAPSHDVIIRKLAALYQERRAVTDLSDVPEAERVAREDRE